ncbi:MAG: phage holin family protein [Rubrivivax sp.]
MVLPGLMRRLLGSLAGIATTRLELLALEIEAERRRVANLWIGATVTLFLLFTGAVLGVVGVLLGVEPGQRAGVAGALALGFLAAGAVAAWRWRRLARARARPPFRLAPPGPSSP